MKPYVLILLTALILPACQANNASPTPIITSTLSPTETRPAPTVTEPPSPIPETSEQKANRELAEAVKIGMRANTPETWTGQYAQYAEWLKNASHPELVTEAQLNELNVFMQNSRKADQLNYFSQNPDNAKIILTDFLVQFVSGSITREAAAAMSLEDLEKSAYSQSEYQRQFLEVVYKARIGEQVSFSPLEDIAILRNKDAVFAYEENVGRDGLHGSGRYGMWVGGDKKSEESKTWSYPATLYGRSSINNESIVLEGVWLGKDIRADYAGHQQQFGQEGIHKTYYILRNAAGQAFLYVFEVAVDAQHPVVIPQGSRVLGGFGTNAGENFYGISPELTMVSLYADGNDTHGYQIVPLTASVLDDMLGWPPRSVKISTGVEFLSTGGTASQFFNPVDGMPIILSQVGVNSTKGGHVTFYDPAELQNIWP